MSQTKAASHAPVYVTIACCKDGLCIDCHKRGNHGDRTKRSRRNWSHLPVDMEYAERICEGWRDMAPEIVSAPLAELPPLTEKAFSAMRADARLRSLAPQMLEALRDCETEWEDAVRHDFDAYHAGHLRRVMLRARAVLAKVEGGQS